jgi:outer membrane protein TolC
VSLQLPIISGENKSSRIKQLRLKAEGISSSISDRIKSVASQNMQLSEDIRQLSFELEVLETNLRILTENSEIYRQKLAEGQVNASDLLEQEIELRKETADEEIRARLTHKKIELITNSGKLEEFIAALK